MAATHDFMTECLARWELRVMHMTQSLSSRALRWIAKVAYRNLKDGIRLLTNVSVALGFGRARLTEGGCMVVQLLL